MNATAVRARKRADKVSVAEYLTHLIAVADKSQRQIATEAGFSYPNIITMFKTGATKIPINKVSLLARALGVDPRHLLRIAMSEYYPDTWAVIEEVLGGEMVSNEELALVQLFRDAHGGMLPDLDLPANRNEITDVAIKCVERDMKARKPASFRKVG